MTEFNTYNDEWKKEASKLTKPVLLDLFQSIARQKETFKTLNSEMLIMLDRCQNRIPEIDIHECLIRDLKELIMKANTILNHA